MNSNDILLLKEELERNYGRKVLSSRDCILLSEEILCKTGNNLNPNTLRRFFRLVKSSFQPSRATLNILSNYSGYNDFEDFVLLRHSQAASLPKGSLLQKEIIKYLISIFENTAVKHVNDEVYMELVKHTILYINEQPALIEEFQRRVSKTKNGQEYYFEQFVNIDNLNGFYGDGLRYYLIEKKGSEPQIWGNALLCFRYWLTENHQQLTKHILLVEKFKPDILMHPFVCGRYYAAKIYYYSTIGIPLDTILMQAREFHMTIIRSSDNYQTFPCFEYVMAEALVLVGMFHEAIFYIEYGLKNFDKKLPPYIDKGFMIAFALFHGLALSGVGDKKTAKKICTAIVPGQFYFLAKKYCSILYMLLCWQIGIRRRNAEKQLNLLIKETGYSRLVNE